ncbi:hypothetical protein Tco_0864166 [Tanacetum coccineum]
MIDYLSIVKIDKVIRTVETDIVKLVVKIESFGMSADEFDKETGSSDGMQPKQADLSCVHALNEPYLHEIHVVPSKHEADQLAVKYSSKNHVVFPPSYKQTYRIHHKAYTPFPVSSMKFLALEVESFPKVPWRLYDCLPIHRPQVVVLGE